MAIYCLLSGSYYLFGRKTRTEGCRKGERFAGKQAGFWAVLLNPASDQQSRERFAGRQTSLLACRQKVQRVKQFAAV